MVGGLADQGVGAPLSRGDLAVLLEAVARSWDVIVADIGPFDRSVQGVVSQFDIILIVTTPDPVGVGRLMRSAEHLLDHVGEEQVVVVVNRVRGRKYYEAEIRAEVSKAFPGLPVLFLPHDHRLGDLSWEGKLSSRGSFARGLSRMARLITETV